MGKRQTDTGDEGRGDSSRMGTASSPGLIAGRKPPKPELKPGSPVSQCPECDLYFTASSAFDRHLIPVGDDVRCMSEDEMRRIGMTTNIYGVWMRGESTSKRLRLLLEEIEHGESWEEEEDDPTGWRAVYEERGRSA